MGASVVLAVLPAFAGMFPFEGGFPPGVQAGGGADVVGGELRQLFEILGTELDDVGGRQRADDVDQEQQAGPWETGGREGVGRTRVRRKPGIAHCEGLAFKSLGAL